MWLLLLWLHGCGQWNLFKTSSSYRRKYEWMNSPLSWQTPWWVAKKMTKALQQPQTTDQHSGSFTNTEPQVVWWDSTGPASLLGPGTVGKVIQQAGYDHSVGLLGDRAWPGEELQWDQPKGLELFTGLQWLWSESRLMPDSLLAGANQVLAHFKDLGVASIPSSLVCFSIGITVGVRINESDFDVDPINQNYTTWSHMGRTYCKLHRPSPWFRNCMKHFTCMYS